MGLGARGQVNIIKKWCDILKVFVLMDMGARTFYVYILANSSRNVLYVGITNNLKRRLQEHQSGLNKGFTYRYNVHYLMYYEKFQRVMPAIKREKQIKKWYRKQKDDLVSSFNPEWRDLTNDI